MKPTKKAGFKLRRIFGHCTRGMTDKTLVCVFPWEAAILQEIHGSNFTEVSIDELSNLKDAVKITNTKLKHATKEAPDLRGQYELMATDFEVNPLQYPQMEYQRLSQLYGMHMDVNLPNVEKVYGSEAQFRNMLVRFVEAGGTMTDGDSVSTESVIDVDGDDDDVPVAELSVKEIKDKLREAGIDFAGNASRAVLEDLLVTATA